ncbi:hypothetical protein ACFL35_19960 [Candidatus Riflebacteria bacterium]
MGKSATNFKTWEDGVHLPLTMELEIGHIHYQIFNFRRELIPEYGDLVEWLRDVRNSLAHLRPVSPMLLLEPAVRFLY